MWERSLRRGPGQTMAPMREAQVDLLAETLVSFANADGGTIVVGVTESGRRTGHVYGDDVDVALKAAVERCRPPVEVRWHQADAAEGTAIVIVVPRSTELHTLSDGRVLIRTGVENRPLSGDEVRHLAATKSTGDFEAEVAPGASLDDFDEDIVNEFVERWEERHRRPRPDSVDDLPVSYTHLRAHET